MAMRQLLYPLTEIENHIAADSIGCIPDIEARLYALQSREPRLVTNGGK